MKNYITIIFSLLLSISSQAQTVDINNRADWSMTGVEGGIPCWENIVDFLSNGGIADGSTDNTTALQNLIDANAGDDVVIYLGPGDYYFESEIEIPRAGHVVIRGAGADLTKLYFNTGGTGGGDFEILKGYDGTETDVTGGTNQNETVISVADISGFSVGDWVEIEEDNNANIMYTDPKWNTTGGQDAKGQIMKIISINGNNLTVDRGLRMDYDISYNTRIKRLVTTEWVGFENFYIENLQDGSKTTIFFKRTANCWVRGIHSHLGVNIHISVAHSARNEIRGCYFEDAWNHGGGGNGYGVVHSKHSSDCLLENCVFRRLRHSMMSKTGANGNVMAYNYSFEYHWQYSSVPNDLSLHGHWPHMNLYEGNIVNRVGSGDFWGPSGPGNTFFRNRVNLGDIYIEDDSHDQNLVGNELITDNIIIDNDITGTFLHGNNEQGTISWDGGSGSNNLINSYYLTSKPSWWGSGNWPSIGPEFNLGNGTNPAYERVQANANYFLTYSCGPDCSAPNLGGDQSLCGLGNITLDAGINPDGVKTFEWFLDGVSQNNPSTTDNTQSVSQGGIWSVQIDSAGECSSSDQVNIIAEIESFDLGPDIDLCADVSQNLVAGNYNSNYTYSWYQDGTNLGLSTNSISINEAGVYEATISASGCSDKTDQITVTSSLPTVVGDTVCSSGDQATLVVTQGTPVSWYDAANNGNLLSSSTTYSPVITTNTTFYVESGSMQGYTFGKSEQTGATYGNTAGTSYLDYGRVSTLTIDQNLTLVSIDIFTQQANINATVNIVNAANSAESYQLNFSNLSLGRNTLNINLPLSPGDYTLDFDGSDGYIQTEYEYGVVQNELTGIISFTNSSNDNWYGMLYNIVVQVGEVCERVPVWAIIDQSNPSCSGPTDCNGDVNGTASVDACGTCSGGNTGITPNSTCTDCNGDINGTASIDACGTCSGGNTGITPNSTCTDCNGDINGTASIDACGTCSGGNTGITPNSTCTDCNGDVNGTASVDACGTCSGGNTGITPNSTCTDCNGDLNGTASIDACGTCSGGNTGITPNSTCTDCNGDLNGTASIDACGTCSGGNTGITPNSTCTDCNGDLNGTASIDACGTCSGGNTGITPNSTCTDCNGDLNGTASIDACGTCSGGNTGITPNSTCTDCNGDVNGTATVDACGTCSGGNTGITPNSTCTDCNSDVNGTATVDACGTCSGGNTGITPNSTCTDCNSDVNGTASVDACGTCSGGNTGITPITNINNCVTAIEDENVEQIILYPNPTESILHISEALPFKIYNQLGILVRSGSSNKIDLSNLPSGIYTVKIKDITYRITKN